MQATDIKYDVPFEVTKKQYNALINGCEGIVAGNEENGKYYIKVWLREYSNHVIKIYNAN